jgi:hypothetical protein
VGPGAGVTPLLCTLLLGSILASCSLLTSPERLEEFEFLALEDGSAAEESVDARGFGGEIFFVGQMRTPHACFDLRARLERGGTVMTLRVTAEARNAECPTLPGAYRYSGAIRNIKAGTYEFRVVHVVPGQQERVQTFSLEIR